MINHDSKIFVQGLLCLLLFFVFPIQFALAQDNTNGKVGIGTTDPQAKLHIAGDVQVDELSGNGDRTLVATPEGKLKAVNNTIPNPSNSDTLRAKFIELLDDEGDTKFILDANTGEFQMMDNDTVWYELEVNSPIKVTTRFDDGSEVSSSEQSDLTEGIFKLIGAIDSDAGNAAEAIDLLASGTATRIVRENFGQKEGGLSTEFKTTVFLTDSDESRVIVEHVLFIDGSVTLSIKGKNPSKSFVGNDVKDNELFKTVIDTNTKNKTTTVTKIKDADGNEMNEVQAQIKEEIDENNQPSRTLTESSSSNEKENKQTACESTITDTETGNSISNKIDEEGKPSFKIGVGGTIVGIDNENLSITNEESGTSESARIEEIIRTTKEFAGKNQAQDEQINQNKEGVESLDERVTEVENNSGDGGGGTGSTTAEKFTASKDGNTNELKPEKVEINAADGNKAEFKKDGIILTGPDGKQLFIDCFGVSKNDPNKAAVGFIAIDFNTDDQIVEIFGDLEVSGSITELGKKVTKIDHPDDPTNQFLQHSFVGTDELLNEYSGNITTDSNGNATVELPSYVESFNTDFRYQLTVIGSFAQAIVAKEITNNQFFIRTNEPNIKVSWEVKGVRTDSYAQQNPLQVEVTKENSAKGTMIYDSNTKTFTKTTARKVELQQANGTANVE